MRLLIETIPWWIWLLVSLYVIHSLLNWLIVTEKNTHWLWRLIVGFLFFMFICAFVLHRMIIETGYLVEYLPIVNNVAIPIMITLVIVSIFYPRSAPISEERKKIISVGMIFGGFLLVFGLILLIIGHYYDYIASFFK